MDKRAIRMEIFRAPDAELPMNIQERWEAAGFELDISPEVNQFMVTVLATTRVFDSWQGVEQFAQELLSTYFQDVLNYLATAQDEQINQFDQDSPATAIGVVHVPSNIAQSCKELIEIWEQAGILSKTHKPGNAIWVQLAGDWKEFKDPNKANEFIQHKVKQLILKLRFALQASTQTPSP